MNKDQLIRICIFVKIGGERFSRSSETYVNVFIDQQWMPGLQPVIAFWDIKALEETRFHVAFYRDLGHYVNRLSNTPDLGGAMEVVEEGGHAVKPHSTKELFVMDPSSRFIKYRMPFLGDGP